MPKRLSILLLALLPCSLAAQEMAPFVIPADGRDMPLIAAPPSPPILPDGPRLVARAGRFERDGKPCRVWGMNMCFGACFPEHADAARVAARLAGAGVNSIRFHHMDTSDYPRGIWAKKTADTLSEEALDRLDYFIDQLARRGITSNINLHVGRTHSRKLGLPDTESDYDKMAGIFAPRLIEAQKKYARDLLGHVNAYRKVRYADDPAVAFVEISNEDSLFMWGSDQYLRQMPEFYAKILREQYNAWLKARYGATDRLRAAWGQGSSPLGGNLLADGTFRNATDKRGRESGWVLEQHAGCQATFRSLTDPADAARVEIGKQDGTDWHVQLGHAGLKVRRGEYYSVLFRARADAPRPIGVYVGQAHEPWGDVGLDRSARLTKEFQDFRMGFVAEATDDNVRVAFKLGNAAAAVELADVRFCPGGREGLPKDQTLDAGTVALFAGDETVAQQADRMRFLAETEKGYFDGMKRFIQQDLGCKALVTGTIVMGPLGLWAQSDMDFIDAHAYWQHPHFPGRPWDPNNWTVAQKAMTDQPERSTLFNLAGGRLAGKPYTVSEYNHPAPNDYQAECVPMLAAFAAAQGWDGIWLFTYSHSADWDGQSLNSYFDMDTNPAKWGFMRAGTAIFRDEGVGPLTEAVMANLRKGDDLPAGLGELQRRHARNMMDAAATASGGKLTAAEALRKRVYVTWGGGDVPKVGGAKAAITWREGDKKGHGNFLVVGPGAMVLTGRGSSAALAGAEKPGGPGLTLRGPDFPVAALTALDGKPLSLSDRALLTACGRCENTDMGFSPDRRTVGRNWGKAPVRIETVEGTLLMPGNWTCAALGPDGAAVEDVPAVAESGFTRVEISGKFRTMWYLLTRRK